MANIPVEIWMKTFDLACTDGGRTACAISEVSHYFREIVLPLQLDNVALMRFDKTAKFEELLRARKDKPHLRHVHHLFLGRASMRDMRVVSSREENKQRDSVLHSILSYVAPELITFTNMNLQYMISKSSVVANPFPKLRELTIHCFFITPIPTEPSVSLQSSFPSLKRLHILTCPNVAYVYTSRAPSLTHLRLSTVSDIQEPLFRALSRAITPSKDTTTGTQPGDEFALGRSLQQIVIRADMAHARFLGFRINGHANPVVQLKSLDKLNKLTVLSIESLTGSMYVDPPTTDREDWEDRLRGGCGCWGGREFESGSRMRRFMDI